MKRMLALLLTLLLIPVAMAETTILGYMPDCEYIHQYAAPNGQLLWFTAIEEDPYIVFDDVNFDGHEDIVIFVAMGASNAFAEFFVYDAAKDIYVLAEHPEEELGICNYQLYPELGIVESRASNGAAGAWHEICLYCWEGTMLKLIRSAVSEEKMESTFADGIYTETYYTDILHIAVRDHERADYDDALVWEVTIPMEETEYRDVFSEETDALWQGLK